MKKLLIVLLSVLILLSFAACEKDKTDEVVETFEKYVKYSNINLTARRLVTAVYHKDSDSIAQYLKDLIPYIDESLKDSGWNGQTVVANDITIEDSVTTCNDVKVTYKYLLNGQSGTFDVIIGGSYKYKDLDKRATVYGIEASFDLTINGEKYPLTFTQYNSVYEKATVDGKDVDVRLLNSEITKD